MARIRSIKPEFFRHETLQDLEIENPGKYPMLVFAGLWGHCDSRGRFEWRPRQLKLDILPFLQFDMGEVLALLERAGMVKHYSCNGKDYGEIKSFEKHQRLSGKEASGGEKYPSPISEATGKQLGSNGEIPNAQEEEEEEEEEEEVNPLVISLPADDPTHSGPDEPDNCPHQEILDLYRTLLPDLPQPRIWEGARQSALRARWRWVLSDLKAKGKPASKASGLDFFARMFRYVGESDFLCGRTAKWVGADLGWLVKAENFAKVLQGNYENKEAA